MPAHLTLFVRGLEFQAFIGLHDHERAARQPLVIDMEVRLRPRPIASLADTVDYGRLAALARARLEEGHIDLVETLAEDLARAALELPGVTEARVRVEKPKALAGALGAGVEVRLVAGTPD